MGFSPLNDGQGRPGQAIERRRVRSRALGVLAVVATVLIAPPWAPAQDIGEKLFDVHCSACHQYDDQGMGEAPPLMNAPWVNGPAERLVLILLHGLTGRIEFRGKTYDREMPGFGRSMSDGEIAALATYVRLRFGPNAGPVSTKEVAGIRMKHEARSAYWPADELLEIR